MSINVIVSITNIFIIIDRKMEAMISEINLDASRDQNALFNVEV